jgi:hypothetical protein
MPSAPFQVLASFEVHSPPNEAAAVRQRLELAAEDGGEGLFRALAANGVPLQPTLSVGRPGEVLVGPGARGGGRGGTAAAAGTAAGAALAAAGGTALVVGGAVLAVYRARQQRQARAEAAAAAAVGAKLAYPADSTVEAPPSSPPPRRRSADGMHAGSGRMYHVTAHQQA